MDGYYAGKIAVITGGATGIGLGLARALAAAGATVILASTNRATLEQAARAIRDAGGKAEAEVCDVADRAAVRALAAAVTERHGRVDLLFANAGVTTSGAFLDHRDEDWDWVHDVVLRGVTNCIQAFYPLMAERASGKIVVTGSQAGLVPDWALDHGPYTAAKSAVMALVMALRPEAARHGVGVSMIIPAATMTEIMVDTDRSRPASLGPSPKGEITVRADAPAPIADMKFMLQPDEVAEIVLPAIVRDEPIIVTHGGLKPLVEEYFGRILAAYDTAIAREKASSPGSRRPPPAPAR